MKSPHLIAVFVAGLFVNVSAHASDAITGINYQSPYCGCCNDWVKHLEENNIQLDVVHETELSKVKIRNGLQPTLTSCHTAEINGYAFEGHVPAKDIKQFLKEKPKGYLGLTVPGMPMGSPGMEYNDQKDPYKVMAFKANGKTEVWKEYHQKEQ